MFEWLIPAAVICATTLASVFPEAAQDDERVLSFDSVIQIQADSSMYVTETIRVRALGREIKRGMYREFPTKYKGSRGETYRVGFTVIEVGRDGHPEPFHVQSMSNGQAVYIGNKDVFLRPGEYTYTLTYRTDRQLGFFDDHDELYWNVNGLGWGFPIDRVRAEVLLPGQVAEAQMELEAYTGPSGAKGRDFRARTAGPGRAEFEATRPFGPHEGLTIVVSFPKGVVTQPSTTDILLGHLRGSRTPVVFFALWIAVILYFLIVWALRGRDPRPGRITPQANPPEGFSPAALRYISKMKYDDKVFSVALIAMAVKGYLRIDEVDGRFVVERDWAEEDVLTDAEHAIAQRLFNGPQAVVLDSANYQVVGAAKLALMRALHKECAGKYFVENGWFAGLGCLVSSSILILGILRAMAQDPWAITIWVSLVPLLLINTLFQRLLRKPTPAGRRLLDEVEGFKTMLAGQARGPASPEQTSDIFEKYLPFAIALDYADAWSAQFTSALAQQEDYYPRWYHTRDRGVFDADRFAHRMGRSFSHAVSSACTSPTSSSGGDGGGSSGGGGGGGGGGGW